MEKRLEMRGGILGGLVPLLILIIGLVWLSVAERGGTKPFWACAWIALAVGLFFAKTNRITAKPPCGASATKTAWSSSPRGCSPACSAS